MGDEPGLMMNMIHEIRTRDSTPCQTLPHHICPAWRDSLREEIQKLREAGIIEPSNRPWSSLIVPVKKPDGSLYRLVECIDHTRPLLQATCG